MAQLPRFTIVGLILVLSFVSIVGCHGTPAESAKEGIYSAKPAPMARHATVPPLVSFEVRLPSRNFTPAKAKTNWSGLFAKPELSRVHMIVQLLEVPDEQVREQLADAGIVLGQPLSGCAYLATVKRDIQTSSPVLKKIRWVGSLSASDKIAPELRQADRAPWARRITGRIELVVKLFPDADFNAVVQGAKDIGGDLLGEARTASIFTVSLPVGCESELAGIDDVRFIEPMPPPGQSESDRARAHVHADVGAIPAGHPDGTNIIVAVFDDAHASATHPDFSTRSAQGDTGPFNPQQHPTMTAGMIAGDGSQSLNHGAGTANQWRGLAPAAQIRSYSYTNSGSDHVADYLNDVIDAVQNDNVNVLNNSWGDFGCTTFPYGSYAGRAPFLDGVVTGSLGRPVAIVFSAGNERDGFGSNNDTSCITNTTAPFANYTTLNHPKSAKNVILVGAIDSANNVMSDYSSWGPTLDGRIKPDVVASGHHNGKMTSGVSKIDNPFGNPVGNPNQQDYRTPNYPTNQYMYAWFSQTSCASAVVSGGIALMLDDWHRTFPGRADPLPSTLRALLVHNAQDLDDATTWYNPGPDYASGYGLVQINETLQSLEHGDALEGSVPHQGEVRYLLNVPAGTAQVKVTLAWDDPPAVENANPALIDDLDLVVTNASGTRCFPWTLDPANPAANAVRTREDHVNNLEQVVIDAPAVETWFVIVRGTNVPQGRQSFSIVTANSIWRRPIDLILALDTSDSMNSPASSDPGALPKIELLRRSVKLFLETWNLHAISSDRVGIATFSSNVATVPNAIPALQPFIANFNSVSSYASSLTASGCTALGGALQVAFNSYDSASINKRAILILTDGMQTANPFVGETGTPSQLQIASYPLSGILPFGAWFCTTTTATGPGGSAIVPDGLSVADHGAEIYTIGVGVNGTGFHELIERLATENHGLSHFTTTPDSDLDILFINDLVRALKSTTLELIETDSGTLIAGASKDISFPVNATSRSITAVVSWQGITQVGAVVAHMTGPSGTIITPSHIRQEGFFTILKYDLPRAHEAEPGTWRLMLNRDSSPAVTYQVSIITDDSCLHYDFGVASKTWLADDPLYFTARISSVAPISQHSLAIKAKVLAPANPLGNLLAKWVPETKAAQEYLAGIESERFSKMPSSAVVFENALAEVSRNPEFQKVLRQSVPLEVTLNPAAAKGTKLLQGGTSVFTGTIKAVPCPGTYEILWEIEGMTPCGPVHRQELGTVRIRTMPERSTTPIKLISGPSKTFTLTLKPMDSQGNLLGPGLEHAIDVTIKGFKPAGKLLDRLDGSYSRTFKGVPTGPVEAQILVHGKRWTIPVSQVAQKH